MSGAGLDNRVHEQPASFPIEALPTIVDTNGMAPDRRANVTPADHITSYAGRRRTPRQSLVVVLPENHAVSPDVVTEHLSRTGGDQDDVEVIVACAGQPTNLAALQRRVRDLQVLLAPAGTSSEDLRELAMKQAPGDIVTLLSGTPRTLHDA